MSLLQKKKRPVIIGSRETALICASREFICLGSREDLSEIAKNLYSGLLRAEEQGFDTALCEDFGEAGIGLAIMNRLIRAAGFKYIR